MLQVLINSLKPVLRLMVLVFFFLILLPKVLDDVDSRGIARLPFAISVDDSSLAVMALTDIRSKFETALEDEALKVLENWGQVTLNAGNESTPVMEKIFPPEPLEPILEMNGDSDQLTGMVISQKSVSNQIILAHAKPIKKLEEVSLRNIYGEWEPLEVRKQKLLMAVQSQQLKQPSVKDKAQKLIEQVLQDKKREQVRRVITSQSGGQILVSQPGMAINGPLPSSQPRQSTQVSSGDKVARRGLHPTRWEDHHERPVLISGTISFGGGLAFTNSHSLSISRIYDGKSQESAKIWIQDARFEVPVQQAKGYLIAELHDHSGLLIAYKELDLSKLSEIPKNQYKINDVHLRLRPVEQGALVHVISGYSYQEKILTVDGATVTLQPFDSELKKNLEGHFVEPSLEMGSDIIVKAEAKDHWPTLARVTSGAVATVRLFHNSMMKALIDIVSLNEMERKENQFKGIIWGIVTKNGRPISNAQVDISGDTGALSYINSFYLPDVALSKTSENGMFAVVGAEEGLQSLRVTYNGVPFPAQVIKTVGGHVSFIEINFEKPESVRLKVVDPLSQNQSVNATIRGLGSDTVIENVTEGLDVEFQKHPLSFHFLEADAGFNYELTRVEDSLNRHVVRVPLVQRQWLEGILAKLKVNRLPETGVIVGWVNEDGFDIILDDGRTHPDMNTLYFNEDGQLVSQNENPSGFIVYNAPVGQRTLTVLPHTKKTVITKVITVDDEFVSVFYKKVR